MLHAEHPPASDSQAARHCGNVAICGNSAVYRRPSRDACTAIIMAVNPVGFALGAAHPCEGCGGTVTPAARPDAAAPDIHIIRPEGACLFPNDITHR